MELFMGEPWRLDVYVCVCVIVCMYLSIYTYLTITCKQTQKHGHVFIALCTLNMCGYLYTCARGCAQVCAQACAPAGTRLRCASPKGAPAEDGSRHSRIPAPHPRTLSREIQACCQDPLPSSQFGEDEGFPR